MKAQKFSCAGAEGVKSYISNWWVFNACWQFAVWPQVLTLWWPVYEYIIPGFQA